MKGSRRHAPIDGLEQAPSPIREVRHGRLDLSGSEHAISVLPVVLSRPHYTGGLSTDAPEGPAPVVLVIPRGRVSPEAPARGIGANLTMPALKAGQAGQGIWSARLHRPRRRA